MTFPKVNRRRNTFTKRKDDHLAYMYSIHRARVTDVFVDKGTMMVNIEGHSTPREINIPLMGLSMPPKESPSDQPETRASWGRYIPQKNDLVLVGFNANGELYSFGYHAIFYEGFGLKDDGRESKGGIGWGEASAKRLKSGDWDWRAARGANLYLGDKAQLGSGTHSITVNKNTGDITSTSTLLIDRYGSSEHRKGGARRRILPTDPTETEIYNTFAQVAQESTDVVRRGFPAIEMVRNSIGEVIDETTFQLKVSTLGGTTIRALQAVKDPVGATDLYLREVDDLGNFGVTALTALMFQWNTPAATWDIKNLVTNISSVTSYTVTSPLITLAAATSAILDSPLVQLGGSTAVNPLVKGTDLVSAINQFALDVGTAVAVVGSAPQNATALGKIAIAAVTLAASVSANALSTGVFLDR